VYHWSAQLVPPKWAPLASYITGWTNFIGNAAGDASFASFFASFFNAGLEASRIKGYEYQASVGVAIGVLLLWSVLNWFRIDQVGWINNLAAFVHAGSIITIIITILVTASKSGGGDGLMPGDWVWTDYENLTSFTDDAKQHALNAKSYVSAMGITIAMFSFSGFEASAHMAEETHCSAVAAPTGLIYTVFATGFGGFAYVLALLYATNNFSLITTTEKPDDDSSQFLTSNAAVNVFINACGWNCGAGLTWLVVINLFFAGIASVAVTGRITFALLRDKAFPYSDFLVQVHPTLKSPIRAIMFVFALDAALLLLGLNPKSGTAFTAIVGLCTIGFMVSYAIPVALKVIFQPKTFPVTSMSLGRWTVPCGIASSMWLFGTSCLFLFPTTGPLTLETMNWLIVVIAGCFLMGASYWFYTGHKTFTGPPIMDMQSLLAQKNAAIDADSVWTNVGDVEDAATEEFLTEQYVDAAAAAKKAREESVVGIIANSAEVIGTSMTTAVQSSLEQTGSIVSTVGQGIAVVTDGTVRFATTGSIVAPSDPNTLKKVYKPSGAVLKDEATI